ncbi:MAG: hypothetical protein KGK01_11520 [Bradyrhizobium sp.]|nr:hypothetical protein [Pseudomonadota bacterium]MDE2065704.1 hypothetical protein [Bradyrhizobium sp.]MDE2243038.1 hypothetical protein [Bradyrhizobium sp.]MDE2470166.1 hypothetical protein [Bradyrhizobium sp.]
MQSKSQVDQVLCRMSETREIPGVVAMAATSKEVIHQGAFGKRDLAKDEAMTARENAGSDRSVNTGAIWRSRVSTSSERSDCGSVGRQ